MSSLKAVGRSTAARKVGRLTATNKTDRVSLCTFTFSDGRRCRTPRVRNNAHFCFYHAQKEARAGTTQKLGKDLGYFFAGDYLYPPAPKPDQPQQPDPAPPPVNCHSAAVAQAFRPEEPAFSSSPSPSPTSSHASHPMPATITAPIPPVFCKCCM